MNLLDKFKTIFVNFHYFPFRQAKKFPLRVHHSVKLGKLGKKGSIVIEDPNAKIYIGFKGSFNLASKRTFWYVEDHAKLVFQGSAFIAAGSQIAVWDGGTAIFGKDFFANDNFFMTCHDKITFGNNVLIGWDVVFMSSLITTRTKWSICT